MAAKAFFAKSDRVRHEVYGDGEVDEGHHPDKPLIGVLFDGAPSESRVFRWVDPASLEPIERTAA